MFYLPTLAEYHVNQSYALHGRGNFIHQCVGDVMNIHIGYTIFCVWVWFILHRVHLVYFAQGLVYFTPGSGSFFVPSGFFCTRIIPFIYTLNIFIFFFFFLSEKNYTVYITQKKEHDCALLLKLKKTVDLQLASCYTTDSDGIVQQPS